MEIGLIDPMPVSAYCFELTEKQPFSCTGNVSVNPPSIGELQLKSEKSCVFLVMTFTFDCCKLSVFTGTKYHEILELPGVPDTVGTHIPYPLAV
jgi:hypothetical protein